MEVSGRSTIARPSRRGCDEAGYRTAMLGKYFNGYEGPYVPPGWDRWFATYVNGAFYDYLATDDGVVRTYGSDPADYGTTVLATEAVRFIESTPARHAVVPVLRAPRPPRARDGGAGRSTRVHGPRGVAAAQLRRGRRLRQARVHPGPAPHGCRRERPDRRVPPQPVRLAARRGSRGRDDRGCPRSDGEAVEHADRLHLRQRDALGRAPLGDEARALRGEHPRAVHRALRPDDRIPA